MIVNTPIILRVWEGDFGAPSVDPFCVYLMALLKFRKVNVTIENASTYLWCPIPSVQYENNWITDRHALVDKAKTLCDKSVTTVIDEQFDQWTCKEILVYSKYFSSSFENIFFFECWLNDINYHHAIKPWYKAVIPFPFNCIYLSKKRKDLMNTYKDLKQLTNEEMFLNTELQKLRSCLDDFASMLKDGRPYFFGNIPSSLDALIYSYLVVALNIPLPDTRIQTIIQSNDVLTKFVENITNTYFPNTTKKFKYVKPVGVEGNESDNASVTTIFITGAVVTAIMMWYSWRVGLFSFLKYH